MILPKVLVGVTVYDGKEYIWDKFYENLTKLNYPNYDIFVVDNSKNNHFAKKLKKQGVNIVHIQRAETSRESLTNAQNVIRDKVLSEGYDYLLFVESDLIPPRDIIQRLLVHNELCVGCMYYIGYDYSKDQPPRPCLFTVNKKDNGELETKNLSPQEGWSFFGHGLVKLHGFGFGTTLINRKLIEKFKFWFTLDTPVKHSDVLWYMDLHNNGYSAYVDTDLVIPHWNSDWKHVKDI
jgi:hypothetical protein